MDNTVGQIQYDARIETKNLRKDAADADSIARKAGDDIGDSTEKGTSRAGAALDKFGSALKGVAIVAGTALVGGIAAAAKASWDQVDAVQQSTIALGAYEKNGDKVNDVLKSLIAYARSDLGVLFNRKDLFESAQSLKIYGDNTEQLTDHVKILSRSVGLGLSTWEGLNNVIGRVGSTGKLYADDLQYLQNAGFKLDGSLSGTTQSFDSLFKLLDKGIPTDALAGQANTIKGLGIRLETAFRGVGDAILGVNSDTSQFIEGGLGDALTKGVSSATVALKSMQQPIRDTISTISTLATQIGTHFGPKLSALGDTITGKVIPALMRIWHEVLEPLAPVFGTVLVVAIGATIDILNVLLTAFSGVVSFLADNQYIIYGVATAFAFMAGANGVSAAIGALGALSAAVPAMIGSLGALQIALVGFVGWAVFAGAAIGAFVAIQNAARDTMDTIAATQSAIDAAHSSDMQALKTAKERLNSGAWTRQQYDRIVKSITQRASGGPVSANQPYIVGENRDGSLNKTSELFVPRSAGTIVNSKDLQSALGGGGNKQEISYEIGTINIGSEVDGERWLRKLTQNSEIIGKGLTPQQRYA